MSHEIEIRDGKASAFFVKNAGWHNLGKLFDKPPETAREAIIAGGMDWEVSLQPIFAHLPDETQIEVAGQFGVMRDIDQKILGVVGSKYTALQNIEAFNFFNPFVRDKQATFEAGGVLCGGSKVWVLAKVNEGADGEVIDGDSINTYLLLFNSHDGSTSVGVMFTPIRVVCQNTLRAATSNYKGSSIVKVSHTASIHRSLDLVQRTIDTARKTFVVTLEQYRQMQEHKLDIEGLVQYATAAILPKQKEVNINDLPRVIKQVVEYYENGPGQKLPGVHGTLWGGYNAVLGFVDHVRGRTDETRLEASWFGVGQQIRDKAHELALDLVAGRI